MGQNVKISNQPHQRTSFESIARARFYHFTKQHKNPLINFFYNERLRRILSMINFEAKKNPSARIVFDLGCGKGYFSRVLSLRFTTVGLDIARGARKGFKVRVQERLEKLDFILADISFLPFRRHSADIVVCASVLEHFQNLDSLIKKIKDVLKRGGIFIAGYPVETRFFKSIWSLVSPQCFRFIDQRQTYWRNPFTDEKECYWENPHTHKQNYQTIRNVLRRHFKILQKEKLPFNFFPDSITYYECTKMRNEP